MVVLHHGCIWAESEGQGKGSVFSVRLPLSMVRRTAQQTDIHTISQTSQSDTAKKRHAETAATCGITETALQSEKKSLSILVVDDSETSRKMTMKLLTMCGHRCLGSKDGYDALHTISGMCDWECCKRGKENSARATIDAVLIDHHMPLMSGGHKSNLFFHLMSDGSNFIA